MELVGRKYRHSPGTEGYRGTGLKVHCRGRSSTNGKTALDFETACPQPLTVASIPPPLLQVELIFLPPFLKSAPFSQVKGSAEMVGNVNPSSWPLASHRLTVKLTVFLCKPNGGQTVEVFKSGIENWTFCGFSVTTVRNWISTCENEELRLWIPFLQGVSRLMAYCGS